MEVVRTRDLVIFKLGGTTTVAVSPSLRASGWVGGQGVEWYASSRDELAVTVTDGQANAILLWGSDESSDRFISSTRNQPNYTFGVIGFGGWLVSTLAFELYTKASRLAPPLVPIVYTVQEQLLFSLDGLLTNEDEWDIVGDPRAPNQNTVGVVIQPPSDLNDNYLTVQLSL